MKILWHGGVTRTVVLTRRWAIKLPCLVYGWRMFLYGFLANMQEVAWSGCDERLCPVRFSLPGGALIVMPRCERLTDEEFVSEVLPEWGQVLDGETGAPLPYSLDLPVEMKSCSFGRLNGRLVAVDYGGCGRDGRTTQPAPTLETQYENEARETMLASESVLGREWNTTEEDNAWRTLINSDLR